MMAQAARFRKQVRSNDDTEPAFVAYHTQTYMHTLKPPATQHPHTDFLTSALSPAGSIAALRGAKRGCSRSTASRVSPPFEPPAVRTKASARRANDTRWSSADMCIMAGATWERPDSFLHS